MSKDAPLIKIPKVEPELIRVPVEKDPVVKQARAVRERDLNTSGSEKQGFSNAMSELHQAAKADMENFRNNVVERTRDARSQCDLIKTELERLSNEINEDEATNRFAKLGRGLENSIREEKTQTKNEGIELYKNLFQVEVEWADFRTDNQITRRPIEPQDLKTSLAILVSLVIVEVAINGFFFMDLTKHGFFGGMFEAILFAPINVLSASILGYYAFRYVQHIEPWKRNLAVAIGTSLAIFILALNGYLAALRLSLKKDALYDIPELLGLMLSPRILDIMDYKSLGILVLGFVLAGYAAWKAYRLKDPYPGYDEVSRKLGAAKDQIAILREDYVENLSDMKDDALADLQVESQGFIRQVSAYKRLVGFIKGERERYTNTCSLALKQYTARQYQFQSTYASARQLASPHLTKIIEEKSLDLAPVNQIPEMAEITPADSKAVFAMEKSLRRYLDDQEAHINNHSISEIEGVFQLFEDMRDEALRI